MRFLLLLIACFALASTDTNAQILRRKPPVVVVVPSQMPPKPKADEGKVGGVMTEGHRTLYDTARKRAVGPLARKKNISRDEARALIDDIADNETLHMMAAKAGLKFKPQAGGFMGFIQWLIDHQDQILKLVQLILALFGVDVDTAVNIALSIAWDCYCS